MSRRKDQLKALLSGPMGAGEAAPPAPAPAADTAEPARRTGSGAVKAMGLSLQNISAELEEARHLRQALAEGVSVVKVSPARIHPSFMSDRLSLEGEDFEGLKQSIAAHGQQVPVLLRPHPEREGDYQTVFGHRRVKALSELGLEVEAIIRPLDDEALVIAQGKENAERRDLTFIERALFAAALEARGFRSPVIMAALAIDKTELSRMRHVTSAIPVNTLRAIGPAPKVGRPRFMLLAERLKDKAARARAEKFIHHPSFSGKDSDARFEAILAHLADATDARESGEVIEGRDGQKLAEVRYGAKGATLKLAQGEGFARFLAARLPALMDEFSALRTGGGTTDDKPEGKPM